MTMSNDVSNGRDKLFFEVNKDSFVIEYGEKKITILLTEEIREEYANLLGRVSDALWGDYSAFFYCDNKFHNGRRRKDAEIAKLHEQALSEANAEISRLESLLMREDVCPRCEQSHAYEGCKCTLPARKKNG
jgi:hypothetical protein